MYSWNNCTICTKFFLRFLNLIPRLPNHSRSLKTAKVDLRASKEGPEGIKWELGFACFCTGKMGFRSLELGFESENKPNGNGIGVFLVYQ